MSRDYSNKSEKLIRFIGLFIERSSKLKIGDGCSIPACVLNTPLQGGHFS